MFIVSADDFGLDEQTNAAIIECFKRGFCSSTTIMPNMPGFEQACQLAVENNLANHIGVHLVLGDTYPLTEEIKRFPRLCDKEGRLSLTRDKATLRLSGAEKDALAREVRSQIERCRAHGINITHIDSHYHIHTEWGIADVVIPVALEENIPFMRISRNCGDGIGFAKTVYKWALNRRIGKVKLRATQLFGSVEDFLVAEERLGQETAASFEVMIHPYISNDEVYVDYSTNIESFTRMTENRLPVGQATSFSGSRYQ